MENQNVEAVVLQIIKERFTTPETEPKLSVDALLEADLELDSLEKLEIIMAIEEKYSISIPDGDLDRLRIVQHFIDITNRALVYGN